MVLRDLLEKRERPWGLEQKLVECDVIAYDSYSGRQLFNTRQNKEEFVETFFDREIICIYGDLLKWQSGYLIHYIPVIKVYLTHME